MKNDSCSNLPLAFSSKVKKKKKKTWKKYFLTSFVLKNICFLNFCADYSVWQIGSMLKLGSEYYQVFNFITLRKIFKILRVDRERLGIQSTILFF